MPYPYEPPESETAIPGLGGPLPQAEISCLLQALTLRALHGLEEGGLGAKIDGLQSVIVRTHRAEMQRLDEGTTVLGQQIKEIADGMTDDAMKQQAVKLHDLAAKLKAMAHEPTTP